jgi:hypothetical protein
MFGISGCMFLGFWHPLRYDIIKIGLVCTWNTSLMSLARPQFQTQDWLQHKFNFTWFQLYMISHMPGWVETHCTSAFLPRYTLLSGSRIWPAQLFRVHIHRIYFPGLFPVGYCIFQCHRASALGPIGFLNFLTDSHHLGTLFLQKSLIFLFRFLGGCGGFLGCGHPQLFGDELLPIVLSCILNSPTQDHSHQGD